MSKVDRAFSKLERTANRIADERNRFKAQRDELLNALRDTTAILKQYVEDDGGHEAAYEQLNDNDHLIAKIEI